MKPKINQILLITALLAWLAAGCFKQEGLVFDDPLSGDGESEPGQRAVFYPVNAIGPAGQGLLARLTNPEGDTAMVFGEFRSDGGRPVRSVAYLPSGSDTALYIFFDERLLVGRIALSLRDGRKLGMLLDIDDYFSYSCALTLLSTTWDGRPAQVVGRWRVDRSLPAPAPLPVYLRNDCGSLGVFSAIDWATELATILKTVARALDGLLEVDPAIFPSDHLLAVQELLATACSGKIIHTGQAPSIRAFFPDDELYGLPVVSPCNEHNGVATTFSVTTDDEHNAYFLNVQGGPPPYSYAINTFSFRSQPRIPGPLDPALPHLIMVRDARGCISSRIARIGAPQDALCARLCGSTWEAVEATAAAPEEGLYIEGTCELTGAGCRRWREDRCPDGTARSYVAEVLQLQSLLLSFANDGSGVLDYRWRRSDRQRLDPATCTLNRLDNLQEEESLDFFWYARSPELLVLYTAEGPLGKVNVTDGGLFFEQHFPAERETYRFRLE